MCTNASLPTGMKAILSSKLFLRSREPRSHPKHRLTALCFPVQISRACTHFRAQCGSFSCVRRRIWLKSFRICCLAPQSFETLNGRGHRLAKPSSLTWGSGTSAGGHYKLIFFFFLKKSALDGVFPCSFSSSCAPVRGRVGVPVQSAHCFCVGGLRSKCSFSCEAPFKI